MPMGRSGGILEPWELERLPGWARGTEDNVVDRGNSSFKVTFCNAEAGRPRAWQVQGMVQERWTMLDCVGTCT